MKIGILTYFWAINPGTYLQAYSTYKAIIKVFPNDSIELINVQLRKVYFRPSRVLIFKPKLLFKSYCRFLEYKKALKKIKFSEGQCFSRDPIKALKYINRQKYDV